MPRSWMIALSAAFCATAAPLFSQAQTDPDAGAIDWPMFQGNRQGVGAATDRMRQIFVESKISASVVSVCDADSAIDWPMFQGNMQRTGACDYPALEEPTVAWSTRVGIMGYLNNPVIDGDRVYVGSSGTTHNTPDELDGIYCLDLNTGNILWHRPTDADAWGVAINATHVFAGDDGGLFQAIDRETGEVAWTLRSARRVGRAGSHSPPGRRAHAASAASGRLV